MVVANFRLEVMKADLVKSSAPRPQKSERETRTARKVQHEQNVILT